MLSVVIFIFLLSFLISAACIRVLLALPLKIFQSRSNQQHHIHTGAIPRIGGLGIFISYLCIAVVTLYCFSFDFKVIQTHLAVFFGAFLAFCLGLVDDHFPINARFKLFFQILIALISHQLGLGIYTFTIPFTDSVIEFGLISYFVTIAWFILMMNLINLIDGLDGLAGGIGCMLMILIAFSEIKSGISLSFIFAIASVGAISGFLCYNFPPAKVYMGDSGAYLIGYFIAALSLINSEKGTVVAAMLAPLMALALPIADVLFAMFRRYLSGLPIFRPDKRHIHHRILGTGVSSRKALIILYGISLFALLGAILVFVDRGRYMGLFMGFAFVLVFLCLKGQNVTAASLHFFLSDSLQSRKDIRSALYLKDWFISELDRVDSGAHLWSDYHFILKKMGLSRVDFRIQEEHRSFFIPELFDEKNMDVQHQFMYTFPNSNDSQIIFYASKELLSERQFTLICDIAIEAWFKASEIWERQYGSILNFKVVAGDPHDDKSFKSRRLYRPSY